MISSFKHNVFLKIPYERADVRGYIFKTATVIADEAGEEGYKMEITADDECFNKIKKYIVREGKGFGI